MQSLQPARCFSKRLDRGGNRPRGMRGRDFRRCSRCSSVRELVCGQPLSTARSRWRKSLTAYASRAFAASLSARWRSFFATALGPAKTVSRRRCIGLVLQLRAVATLLRETGWPYQLHPSPGERHQGPGGETRSSDSTAPGGGGAAALTGTTTRLRQSCPRREVKCLPCLGQTQYLATRGRHFERGCRARVGRSRGLPTDDRLRPGNWRGFVG